MELRTETGMETGMEMETEMETDTYFHSNNGDNSVITDERDNSMITLKRRTRRSLLQ